MLEYFFNFINMAKKYENFSVGDNLSKTSNSYSAWTNDLLRKLVAGKTIIQPGGSMRDNEVIEAANEHGMAMVFTGVRHFRH